MNTSIFSTLRHSEQGGTLTYFDVKYVWGGCNGKWKDVKIEYDCFFVNILHN